MNVVIISPHFPPSIAQFCAALRERGVTVLAVGDVPAAVLAPGLRGVLADYVHVQDMSAYEAMLRAVALLIHRHGRLDAIESHNEHWLDVEARLREDFNVPGLRPREVQRYRSKTGMAEVLAAHGVPGPAGVLVRGRGQIEDFVRAHGFPVFLKPDVGVGAERALRVDDAAGLAPLLEHPPVGFVLQRYIPAPITTFDGLTDHDGRVVFAASFVYADPIADIVREGREVYFYSRRELPPALADAGERVVRAFDLRARFFHAEFFALDDGRFVPLEINLRPPGGYTTDLMNFASDTDVYRLWARVVTHADASDYRCERRYHAAHLGRRPRAYRVAHDDVAALLGSALMAVPPVPAGLAVMGDPIYLVRHENLDALNHLARAVLERAS
jgi:hypothetical protein